MRWVFFDIAVLVGFGILAVYIINAPDIREFMWRCFYFTFAGLSWGVLTFFCRTKDQGIAKSWMWIDGSQALFTLVVIFIPWGGLAGDIGRAVIVAAGYAFCLCLDLCVMAMPKRT